MKLKALLVFCFHHFRDPIFDIEKISKWRTMYSSRALLWSACEVIYKKVHESEYFDPNESFEHIVENKTAEKSKSA